jgi:Ala-tRNA(Pro) deacylase
MRIAQFLQDHHIRFESIMHPPAFTARKRARFMGLPGQRVAKCVLLHGPGGYFVAVLPATRHINAEKLAELVGGPIRLATCDEIARVFCDCEWGVVAPFGTLYGLPTYLDESLAGDEPIILEGNHHFEAIRMSCRDFVELEHPRRFKFAH